MLPPRVRRASINWGDRAFHGITTGFALLIAALVALLVLELATESVPALSRFGPGFLASTSWNPVTGEFGALPFIYGTLATSALALALAWPIGVGAAAFLTELAPRFVRSILGTMVEMLAAVPSVVYGLWGVFVLVPLLRERVEPWLIERLGVLPVFSGPPFGLGVFAAGLLLAVMILPTLASVSREAMSAVPRGQREALLALGATRWEVIRAVVLAQARSGLVAATVLALGRALGETMATVMVIGNSPSINVSIFAPASTMASVIANDFNEATGLQKAVLLELGLILLVVSLAVNTAARLMAARSTR